MRPENQRCIEPSSCTVFLNQEAEMAIPKKAAISVRKLIPILLADFLDGSVQTQIALLDPDGALADALHLLDGGGWLTNSTVTSPDSVKCWMRASRFCRKNTSPTEGVSSTIRMSGDVTVVMTNAMRATMPLE